MKRFVALMMLLAAPTASLKAAQFEGNPDRMPSIGLNWAGSAEEGESTVFGGGSSAKQNVEVSNGAFVLDLRLPVSNSVTLSAAIGSSVTTVEAPETPLLFGQKSETDGVGFSLGVRFYIH